MKIAAYNTQMLVHQVYGDLPLTLLRPWRAQYYAARSAQLLLVGFLPVGRQTVRSVVAALQC